MDIPRFDSKNVNPRLALTTIGDAFQQFVHEVLLPEHPQLHRFPGGGKDGGIDLIETSQTCLVVECKVVGEDGDKEAGKRWKTVRNNLREYLQDPGGPPSGQSQYGPWYSTDKPINQYVFCVSSSFSNEQQRRDLEQSIAQFFRDLAGQHSHLSHLFNLKVSILDWNTFSTRLQQRPHLFFRWFPSCRPNGLIPLDEAVDVGTFRAYLTDAKLPYYSLAEHLQIVPAESIGILNEESLLARFENPETTGLVISGKGGVGKSRLTLELGWLALRQGWTVMRVQSRLRENALEDLAERLTPEMPALLLVDYIETQTDFGELVENLNLLNDSGVARLRYVASCRTGYYHQAIAASSRHLPVDLTPPPGALALDWYSTYRRHTIEQILTRAGLPLGQQHLAVCHDLPILAVFLAYLHTSGRNDDLADLLTEVEFGRWVAKRVQLSFPSQDVSRKLALLVPLFPIPNSATEQFGQDLYRPVFDRLATDGWIERVPANAAESSDTWVAAHDVLADQILLSYLRGIPNTVDVFAGELFSLAADVGTLSSAIVSLQRIADTPPLNAVKWGQVIANAISANEPAWRNVRDALVRTSLLTVPDRIALLHKHETLWANAEQDVVFQNSLGWFARWVAKSQEEIPDREKETLISWISKAVPFAEKNNFVITWGLRLAPGLVQEAALRWIRTRPALFQTHYLMVAWLELRLPTESIADAIGIWCRIFRRSFHLSFVAKAWLDAGGDKSLVQDAIKDWLVDHKTDAEAQFVYKAWLDAGGDKALVQEALKDWLVDHKTDAEAEFVYNAWLHAEGDKALVQDAIKDWLVDHKTDAKAEFVYDSWLDAGGDKALVQEALKDWLVDHKTDAEAQFVYNAWLHAEGDKALVQDAFKDWLVDHKTDAKASHVYKAWLDSGGDKALVQEPIKSWLLDHKTETEAQFVYKAWLDAGGDKALVQEAIKDWLVDHKTETEAQFLYNSWLNAEGDKAMVEQPIKDWLVDHKTEAEAEFVYKSWLDAGGDTALVQEAIKDWLVDHKTETEAQFLYNSWLNAEGDKAMVEQPIKDWLVDHKTDAGAEFVYNSWLDAGGDTALVQEAIKDWLVDHKTDAEAQFVYNSWLDAGGDTALVQDAIKDWLVDHKTDAEASHVYNSWLDAGGDTALVQEAIKDWLVDHKTDAEASHVYKAWLDANGDKTVVEAAIASWLLAHGEDADADYVFRSWLEAGGNRALVWDAATAWLAKHQLEESAVYVTKFIARQRNLPANTVADVLSWCRAFPTNVDALWRLTQLRSNLLVDGVEEAAVSAAEVVLADLLLPTNRVQRVARELVTGLFSYLLELAETESGPLRERVDSLFVRWLRHPLSFGSDPKPHLAIQRVVYLDRISELIDFGALDLESDRESLRRFMQWLDEWDLRWKQRAMPMLDELKLKHPAPDVWDIVRLEE
jgi:hypothetical protein